VGVFCFVPSPGGSTNLPWPTYRKKQIQNLNKKELSSWLFYFYTNINKEIMTQAKKLENLNSWLGMVTKNKDIIIVTDQILGKTFAIAERTGDTRSVKTNFMTYDEMDAYFFGVIDAKFNKINF